MNSQRAEQRHARRSGGKYDVISIKALVSRVRCNALAGRAAQLRHRRAVTKLDAALTQESHHTDTKLVAVAAVFAAGEDAAMQLTGEMGECWFLLDARVSVERFLFATQRALVIQ